MAKVEQHTVSKFYLRGFNPPDGQKVLQQYSRRTLEVRPVSPADATTRAHFYSVQRPDGEWDDLLEDWLQRIETGAAPALKNLAKGTQPSLEDRAIIAFFIGAMFLRTTRVRENADAHALMLQDPEIAIRFAEEMQPKLRKRFSAEEIEQYKRDIRARNRGIEVSSIYYFIDAPERVQRFAEVICRMAWTVEFAPRDSFFITSDNPAFVRMPKNIRDPHLVALLSDELAELGFPLSRSAFLLCRWKGRPLGATDFATKRASVTRADHLNERTVLSAHEFVFAPQRSQYVAVLTRKHADFRLCHPTLDFLATQRLRAVAADAPE